MNNPAKVMSILLYPFLVGFRKRGRKEGSDLLKVTHQPLIPSLKHFPLSLRPARCQIVGYGNQGTFVQILALLRERCDLSFHICEMGLAIVSV